MMKKTLSLIAVLMMTLGFFSCEPENTTETDALYDVQLDANDTEVNGGGSGGN